MRLENTAFEIARNAALEAGAFLLKNLTSRKEVSSKMGQRENLVTKQDILSEKIITSKILEKFPNHDIVAEEGSYRAKNSRYRWFIDPLDGTTNYVHGFPVFCVSIAFEMDKRIIFGIVYNPNLEELFWARLGKGAFRNGKRINVSETHDIKDSLLATGFPYDLKVSKDNNLDYFNAYIQHAKAIRRAGSAALDLCYTACGIFDGFWEIKLGPWDMAAGVIIATEAGGRITNLRGGTFDLFSGEILASNGKIHSQMRRIAMSANRYVLPVGLKKPRK